MKLSDYQQRSRQTARYPGVGQNPYYPVLGQGGEIGEVCEKIAFAVLDGVPLEELSVGLRKELGDVLWYLSQVAAEVGLELAEIEPVSPRAGASAPLEILGLQLAAYGLAALEQLKKTMRDDAGVVTPERLEAIQACIARTLGALAAIAVAVGTSVEEIAALNIAKLESRAARGVLSGSGDER